MTKNEFDDAIRCTVCKIEMDAIEHAHQICRNGHHQKSNTLAGEERVKSIPEILFELGIQVPTQLSPYVYALISKAMELYAKQFYKNS